MTDVRVPAAPAPQARRRPRPWVLTSLAAVIVLVVGAGLWFAHWRSSLHVLESYMYYGSTTPAGVEERMYFGDQVGPLHGAALSIDIESILPVVTKNTAGARITVVECRSFTGVGAIGDGHAVTARMCGSLVPFQSGRVQLGHGRSADDLLLEVIPRHAGVVRVSGVIVTYSSGLRHGTQHVGPRVGTETRG